MIQIGCFYINHVAQLHYESQTEINIVHPNYREILGLYKTRIEDLMLEFQFGPTISEDQKECLALACWFEDNDPFGKFILLSPAILMPLILYLPFLGIMYYTIMVTFDRCYRQ